MALALGFGPTWNASHSYPYATLLSTGWRSAKSPTTRSGATVRLMKQIATGRIAQVAGKYAENAPMATVCCNACRTCLTTNALGLLAAAGGALASPARRLARRVLTRS